MNTIQNLQKNMVALQKKSFPLPSRFTIKDIRGEKNSNRQRIFDKVSKRYVDVGLCDLSGALSAIKTFFISDDDYKSLRKRLPMFASDIQGLGRNGRVVLVKAENETIARKVFDTYCKKNNTFKKQYAEKGETFTLMSFSNVRTPTEKDKKNKFTVLNTDILS